MRKRYYSPPKMQPSVVATSSPSNYQKRRREIIIANGGIVQGHTVRTKVTKHDLRKTETIAEGSIGVVAKIQPATTQLNYQKAYKVNFGDCFGVYLSSELEILDEQSAKETQEAAKEEKASELNVEDPS